MEISSEFPSAAIWVSRPTSDLRKVKKNYDAPKMKFSAPADGSSFPKPKILSKLAGRASTPKSDAKDLLLSHGLASCHPSPLSLTSSSPSAKGRYVPPARRTMLDPSQPSSPSTSPSISPSTSPPTSPSTSPLPWQSSPSAGSTDWRRNSVTVTSFDPDSCDTTMAGALTPGAGLNKAAPCTKSWRDRRMESSPSPHRPMTACQRSCQARLQRQENLRRRSL